MPVTIQPDEFLKKTKKPFWRNPTPFTGVPYIMIYNRLLNYHHARRIDPKHPAVRDMLTQIIHWIQEYTADMAVVLVNGRQRYRDYRDRHGMISELERQVHLAIAEYDRVSRTVSTASAPSMPPPATQPPQRASGRFGAAPRLGQRRGSMNSLQELFADAPSEQSGDSVLLAHDPMPVIAQGPTPVAAPAGTSRVHPEAFEIAARFVQMTAGGRVTAQDVRDAVPTGPMISSGHVFHDICRALQEMNHNVYHQQNVREDEMKNVLKNATDRRPVMVCVGAGGAALSRVVLCHGMYFEGNGTNIEAAFKAIDGRAGATNTVLYGNGDYDATIGALEEHLTWQPQLGYIKF